MNNTMILQKNGSEFHVKLPYYFKFKSKTGNSIGRISLDGSIDIIESELRPTNEEKWRLGSAKIDLKNIRSEDFGFFLYDNISTEKEWTEIYGRFLSFMSQF